MTPSCKLAPGTAARDYDSTLIGASELSSKKWVFAVQPPGSKKHTRQVVEPGGSALVEMIERLKARSLAAGRPILRMILTYEAGRDGFWLARFLQRRGVEVHVMQASSLPVDRRARRENKYHRRGDAFADVAGVAARRAARVFDGPDPQRSRRGGGRAHREREDLTGSRRSLVNNIDGRRATWGSAAFGLCGVTGANNWPICGSLMARPSGRRAIAHLASVGSAGIGSKADQDGRGGARRRGQEVVGAGRERPFRSFRREMEDMFRAFLD